MLWKLYIYGASPLACNREYDKYFSLEYSHQRLDFWEALKRQGYLWKM